jgi:hypothetical protein
MPNTPQEAKANLEARIAQIRALGGGSKLPKPASEKALALPLATVLSHGDLLTRSYL